MILTVDLETYESIHPALYESLVNEKGKKPKNMIEKAALSPLTGRIVAVGAGFKHSEEPWEFAARSYLHRQIGTPEDDDAERHLILTLDNLAARLQPAALATFNGRLFDLPFLYARAAVLGLSLKWRWPTHKYDSRHVDLMDYFPGKQSHWSCVLTGQGKIKEGSSIAELVRTGQWDEVDAHAIEDVKLNALMLDRISPVLINLPMTAVEGIAA